MSDAEHLADLWKIKLKRLRELDKQAAMLGDAATPAHIQVERGELRAEMGLLDGIASLPIRPQFGEELGPNGRLFAYLAEAKKANEEARRANDSLATMGEQFTEFKDDFRRWQHSLSGRTTAQTIWLSAITIVVIIAVTVALTLLLRG